MLPRSLRRVLANDASTPVGMTAFRMRRVRRWEGIVMALAFNLTRLHAMQKR